MRQERGRTKERSTEQGAGAKHLSHRRSCVRSFFWRVVHLPHHPSSTTGCCFLRFLVCTAVRFLSALALSNLDPFRFLRLPVCPTHNPFLEEKRQHPDRRPLFPRSRRKRLCSPILSPAVVLFSCRTASFPFVLRISHTFFMFTFALYSKGAPRGPALLFPSHDRRRKNSDRFPSNPCTHTLTSSHPLLSKTR